MLADIDSISGGIEVAEGVIDVLELAVSETEDEANPEAEAEAMALERLAAIDEGEIELALKLELILALALERLTETLARASEREVGLIGVVAVAIIEEILAS